MFPTSALRRALVLAASLLTVFFCAAGNAAAVSPGVATLLAPDGFELPRTAVGSSSTRTYTVQNTGAGPLSLVSFTVASSSLFGSLTISADNPTNTTVTLAPNEIRTLTVRFTPTAAGTVSNLMFVATGDPANPDFQTFRLTATGYVPAAFAATPSPVAFGTVDYPSASTKTVTIDNTGGSDLIISSISVPSGDVSTVLSGALPYRIAPGAQGTFDLRFAPTASGAVSGNVTLETNVGTKTIAYSGTGRAPGFSASFGSVDFRNVAVDTYTLRTVTIINTGTLPLDLSGLTPSDPAFSFTLGSTRVAAGKFTVLYINFAPRTPGVVTDELRLTTNDPAGAHTISLAANVTSDLRTLRVAPPAGGDGSSVPTSVELADLDHDGKLDLITSYAGTKVGVALGRGDGTFATTSFFATSTPAGSAGLAVGQFTGDTNLDVVSGGVTFRGTGNGSLVAAGGFQREASLASGDFDGDGSDDLVVSIASTSPIVRFSGGSLVPLSGLASAQGAQYEFTPGDLDRDGDLDFVATFSGGPWVYVVLNDGTGRFTPTRYNLSGSSPAASASIGDFNGDGRPDILAADSTVLRGTGGGAFEPALRRVTAFGSDIVIGDFDGDGRDDGVTASGADTPLAYLSRGLGDGTFSAGDGYNTGTAVYGAAVDLAAGDLNGDGRPDVVVAKGGARVEVLLGQTGAVADGAGKALISEARFGNDGYLNVRNRSSSSLLRLDGWQLRFSDGSRLVLPPSTSVQPGGVLLVAPPAQQSSLKAFARSVFSLPAAAKGVALVDPAGNVVDAVGTTDAGAAFREGAGLPVVSFVGQGGYVRKSSAGAPVDTGDNAADFRALDTAADGTTGTVLGAPRPDGAFGPTNRNDILQSSLLDPSVPQSASPNRVIVPGDATTATTLTINRTITNCSGGRTFYSVCANASPTVPELSVKKLRFRITDLSTFGNGSGAKLVAVASADASYGALGVKGLPLDAPSPATGGGINSTLTATSLLPEGGLAPGQSISVAFTFEVYSGGSFAFAYDTEDDVEPYEAPKADGGKPSTDEPAKGDAPTETPPAAEPVREQAVGTVPQSAISSAPAPVLTPKAPATTTPAKRCVSKAKYKRLSRKQRAKVRICPAKTISKTTKGTR